MRKLFVVAAAILALVMPGAAFAADDPVICVQTYLLDAGYPVGAIDGKLGKTTTALGNEFAPVYPELALPGLSVASAPDWCATLQSPAAQAILAMRALPPANAPADTIARKGGLNFSNALVRENFPGVEGLLHGYTKSLWPGRVTVDTDPARVHSGKSSIRMHLLPGDCGWSTHRGAGEWNDCDHNNARVDTNSAATKTPEMYYGISIMLGQNLLALEPFPDGSGRSDINLFQWFQIDNGPCFNLMYNARTKQFAIDVRCADGVYADVARKISLADTRSDVWHEFVVHANWATDETGFFRVLRNGKMVMAYDGPTIIKAGRAQIAEHPQIYAYGSDKLSAAAHYRTAATVWFDDMIRARSVDALRDSYTFDDAALTDFGSALPIPGLSAEGDPTFLAPGEVDNLPTGAILPGQELPKGLMTGFNKPRRASISNSKAYGLAVADDPAGSGEPTLRFEVRAGDCGQEMAARDDCAKGWEGLIVRSGDTFKEGEHYAMSWKAFIEGPEWQSSQDKAMLLELSQPDFDYELNVTTSGLTFGNGMGPMKTIAFAFDIYDRWVAFEMDVVWSKGDKSRLTLTMDGRTVFEEQGATLPNGEARASFGLRRNGFKNINSVVYYKDVTLTKLDK